MDDVSTQGALYTEDVDGGRRRRRAHGQAPHRGRAIRLLRRGVDRVPRPPGRRLPRLRGRRAAARHAARRRRCAHSSSSARRSPGSSPSGCTCRSASAVTSTISCCREVGVRAAPGGSSLGHARPRLHRASSRSTRTSRTPGGPISGASATCPAIRLARSLPTSSVIPEFADVTDQLERKIMGISLYESQLERLFDGTRADGRCRPRPTAARWPRSAASMDRPSGTGSPAASESSRARPRRSRVLD